jgi:hypothetical protein
MVAVGAATPSSGYDGETIMTPTEVIDRLYAVINDVHNVIGRVY